MKVLMIVTSHAQIDNENPTGLWLEEFAVPYNEFNARGIQVTVASIQGGAAPIDPRSLPNAEQTKTWLDAVTALKQTAAVSSVVADNYDAVFLPGGHGTMFDLPNNATLQQLLSRFAADRKIIAAVCHGPAGFVNVVDDNNRSIVAGKTVTSFTDDEERAVSLDKKMPFLLESKLTSLGARFVAKPNWSDHVEQDGNLITGQNPQSSLSAARAVIAALQSSR